MTWAKIDDKLHSHPKVLEAGPEAMGLFLLALSWCADYLTDGLVPEIQVKRLLVGSDDPLAVAGRLINAGLWEQVEGGYQIHDYLEYNPSAEQVKAEREANAKRQAEWRERKAQDRVMATRNDVTDDVSNGVTNDATNTRPVPVPDPIPETPKTQEPAKAGAAEPPTPQNLDAWLVLLENSKNRQAVLRRMVVALYPKTDPPEYAYIAKVAKSVGGASRLAQLLWLSGAYRVTGDILAYCQSMHKGNAKKQPRRDPQDYARGRSPVVTYGEMPDLPESDELILAPPDGPAKRVWDVLRADIRGVLDTGTFDHLFSGAALVADSTDAALVVTLPQAAIAQIPRFGDRFDKLAAARGVTVEFRNGHDDA